MLDLSSNLLTADGLWVLAGALRANNVLQARRRRARPAPPGPALRPTRDPCLPRLTLRVLPFLSTLGPLALSIPFSP